MFAFINSELIFSVHTCFSKMVIQHNIIINYPCFCSDQNMYGCISDHIGFCLQIPLLGHNHQLKVQACWKRSIFLLNPKQPVPLQLHDAKNIWQLLLMIIHLVKFLHNK